MLHLRPSAAEPAVNHGGGGDETTAGAAGAKGGPDAGEEVVQVGGEEAGGLEEGDLGPGLDKGDEEEDVGEPHDVEGDDEEGGFFAFVVLGVGVR